MVRKAVFAGSFYAKGFNELDKQITNCFKHEKGPGELPTKRTNAEIKAVITPHAGYSYSGPCAAWSYKEIAESRFPNIYIILAPNHSGNGNYVSVDMWETPFGEVRVDKEFVKALMKKNNQLKINDEAFVEEHSIEVQLPFLQFATKDKMHELKIVPIILDHDVDFKALALDLKETILESEKSVVFIISSDFTHYGRNYRYVPFSTDVPQNIYNLDQGAIEFIKQLDPDGLMNYAHEKITTICGIIPIATLLKAIKPGKVTLEQYYTSADITDHNYNNSVSYASIIFH